MRGVSWFRRRRPAVHVQQITHEDIRTAHAWDMNLTQWFSLTDFERAECRRNIIAAPRFEVAA